MNEELLTFDEQARDGGTVLAVSGEIDIGTADLFREATEAFAARTDGEIVLDLAAVTFMDSSGLSVLANQAGAGRPVVVLNPSKVIRTAIRATGLDGVIQMVDQ